MLLFMNKKRFLLLALAISVFIQFSLAIIHLMLGHAVGIPSIEAPVAHYIMFIPIILLFGSFVPTPGAAGPMEAAYILCFPFAPAKAIALALLFRMSWYFLGMIGYVVYLLCPVRRMPRLEAEGAEKIVDVMRRSPYGSEAAIIGDIVREHPGRVVMRTSMGASRRVDMLIGEQLPRIC